VSAGSKDIRQDHNDELTRVGPGTPMGELMRHYWLSVMHSSELVAGGSPVRLPLLGERLVAFRSPSGELGVMDHRCPHRNASLFYGRNEEGGLRCVYHGWKFDPQGRCVDVPNIVDGDAFKAKVRTTDYKACERHGIVWVYLGRADTVPPVPRIEVMEAEEGDLEIEFAMRECNWLQALEGDIDTSHLGFLHVGNVQPDDLLPDDPMRYVVANRAPELEVADAPWGTTYCATKRRPDGGRYLRYANFMFPCWTQAPQGQFENNLFSRAWVPMDDTHTMSITLMWKQRGNLFRTKADGEPLPGVAPLQLLPNTTDWLGRYRCVQNARNDYLIDREAQRGGRIYSGISNIGMQDQAVTESMGEISDRSREHLTPSDLMIIRTRRRLLLAARALAKDGTLPPGVDDPFVYRLARSGDMMVDGDADWEATYQARIKEAVRLGE
jgi:phenylpropionate dioxygenase-like ring-hydroxylating dioxygenase large terminal subunit